MLCSLLIEVIVVCGQVQLQKERVQCHELMYIYYFYIEKGIMN